MIHLYQKELPPPSLSQNDLIVLATLIEYVAIHTPGTTFKTPGDHILLSEMEALVIEQNQADRDKQIAKYVELAREALRRYTQPRPTNQG